MLCEPVKLGAWYPVGLSAVPVFQSMNHRTGRQNFIVRDSRFGDNEVALVQRCEYCLAVFERGKDNAAALHENQFAQF